jgi:transmembrane sensor
MIQGEDENLRQEAAGWFARMRGPGAEGARADFDAWRADPRRQAAYDRLVRQFEDSAILGHSRLAALRVRTEARGGRPPAMWWSAAAAFAAAVAAIWAVAMRPWDSLITPPTQRFVAAAGQILEVQVAPGVTAVLDTDTVLTVAAAERPRLVLQHGRARIATTRPLEAEAGRTRIRADHAAFDLRLQAANQIEVATLHGAISTATDAGLLQRVRAQLPPGQRLTLGETGRGTISALPLRDRAWPTGLLFFNEAPLDQVLAEANRYGGRKIRLAETHLAGLRVNGALKVTDPVGLANALAAALGLNVAVAADGALVLSRSAA